jgi:RNA polymerase sigma-32 factor
LEALGIFPAPKLLASSLDVKEEEVEDMQKRLAYTDVSMETPIRDEGDDTIMDMMKTDENVEEIIAEKEKEKIIVSSVAEFKKTLNEKELYIFEHRVLSEEPQTLQDIGAHFSISRERARQIESRVVKKFKERFKTEFEKFDF